MNAAPRIHGISVDSFLPHRLRRPIKQQKVDRLNDLRVDDPIIDRDAQILEKIKSVYRKNRLDKQHPPSLQTRQALYSSYRGIRFPLSQRNGKKLPAWRYLSPWMKIQIASLAMAEHGYLQMMVHPHDELLKELEARKKDLKDYLRDTINRSLRKQLGATRWFFFVMEDRDSDGNPVLPHAHGSILHQRTPIPERAQPRHLHFRRLAEDNNLDLAESEYDRELTKEALKVASGNADQRRNRVVGGRSQHRNVWLTKPTRPFTNEQWVTYAFKNSCEFSTTLGERRLAMSQSLTTEARKLWQLMRDGEKALNQWPNDPAEAGGIRY